MKDEDLVTTAEMPREQGGLRQFAVRVMWRKKGQHKDRIVWAEDIKQARSIAFAKFGPNRGVRPVDTEGQI